MARRIAVSILVTSALIAGVFALGGGCAQIIGADFDKPFAAGGGGATDGSTGSTASGESTGSTASSSGDASSSSGAGPLCNGNGTCDSGEVYCSCADCPPKCGDGCCTSPETPCNCQADCKEDACPDMCCSGRETVGTCADCMGTCGDGFCDTSTETCACDADCPCSGTLLCTDGECKAGNGEGCGSGTECGSGNCVDSVCCGVPCAAPCQTCASDFASCIDLATSPACGANETCVAGLCQCGNLIADPTETDVDCGGDCVGTPCADLLKCLVETDCASGYCCDCGGAGLVCLPIADCPASCPM